MADSDSLFKDGSPVNDVGMEDRKLLLKSTSCSMVISNVYLKMLEGKQNLKKI